MVQRASERTNEEVCGGGVRDEASERAGNSPPQSGLDGPVRAHRERAAEQWFIPSLAGLQLSPSVRSLLASFRVPLCVAVSRSNLFGRTDEPCLELARQRAGGCDGHDTTLLGLSH